MCDAATADVLTHAECKLLGHMLYAAYHCGNRAPGSVDREIDASIGRLVDTAATYRARGHRVAADGVQERIDTLVALRAKLERRRAALATGAAEVRVAS